MSDTSRKVTPVPVTLTAIVRTVTAIVILAALAACTSAPQQSTVPMAASVTLEDPWAVAAESGMTAVFGTLTNDGETDVRVVGGESPVAARVEIHEVAPDGSGAKMMRPKDGGLIVAPHGSHELAPGGDHLMLMDLTEPLQPGADVALTVMFEDGSTLPITAQIRDFAGGNEEYAPEAHDHDHADGHGAGHSDGHGDG